MKHTVGNLLIYVILTLVTVILFMGLLSIGTVSIPLSDVWAILSGGEAKNDIWRIIILESRLPMAIGALLCGVSLSVAGLQMQTTFQNPLAGPSILGISSGASLGVSLIMLGGLGLSFSGEQLYGGVIPVAGALIGSGAVILMLLGFSSVLRNGTMLLIVGVMISYLCTSIVSLLNFFSPAEGVKSFVVWGMGSFSGVSMGEIPLFSVMVIAGLAMTVLLVKPMDAMLLGERYAESMGYSISKVRMLLLVSSGLLTAAATAFCGPVGFIGMTVPHVARMFFRTSLHSVLFPASILLGALVSLLCAFLTVLPSASGILPINAVTPLFGVPVILFIIFNRKRLRYFN